MGFSVGSAIDSFASVWVLEGRKELGFYGGYP